MPNAIDVAIPVLNDQLGLRRCLTSVHRAAAQAGIGPRVVVADNGSVDSSAEVARELGAACLVLPGLRVAGLRNRAAAVGDGSWIAFVDADHELDRGWFAAAIAATAIPDIGAVGAPYSSPEAGTWVQQICNGMGRHSPTACDVEWLGGGNLIVRRSLFERIGGFDETLETCEDIDLCHRLRATGARIRAVTDLRSIHHGDPADLRGLFGAELWRGRDNLRVSLRHGVTIRDLPSVGFPIALLVMFGLMPVTAFLGPWIGWGGLAAALAATSTIYASRSLLIFLRVGRHLPHGWIRSALVAVTYESARALCLVTRTAHRRAQSETATAATSRSAAPARRRTRRLIRLLRSVNCTRWLLQAVAACPAPPKPSARWCSRSARTCCTPR